MTTTIAPILVEDLTEGHVDGDGVFDVLMRAAKDHLEQEFKKQRIKGPEYSTVYLGAMTAVLQQAIQFLLGQKQTELLQAQLDKLLKEIEIADKQAELTDAQIQRILAEIDLLRQRIKTERAQIEEDLDGVPIEGIIGKKKELHEAQKEGFYRDAEQKLAKYMIDTWSIRRTTDEEGTGVEFNGLNDYEINRVLNKAKSGINLEPYSKHASANFTFIVSGMKAFFTDTSTIYADDPIISWEWNFGDAGAMATGQQTEHTFSTNDTAYDVILTITTQSGQKDVNKEEVVIGTLPTT